MSSKSSRISKASRSRKGGGDIFEEAEEDAIPELKEEYAQALEERGIEYNQYDGKFSDTNNPKVKKLVNLLPEKYLRPAIIETVEFKDFKKENDKIINAIEAELKQFVREVK